MNKIKSLVTSFRFILRYKEYSLLNIIGLAIGMASAMFIILWVNSELNIDKFHKNGKNIYQVNLLVKYSNGEIINVDVSNGPLAPAIIAEVPEIKTAVRTLNSRLLFRLENKLFYENGIYADSNFFNVFSYELIWGSSFVSLNDPNSVVISEKVAGKYFGKEDPTGKSLIIRDEFHEEIFTVTGVFKDVTKKSSFQFDFVIPLRKQIQNNENSGSWDDYSFTTYILKRPNADNVIINSKINSILKKYSKWAAENNITLYIRPYEDLYLYGNYGTSKSNSSKKIVFVRILSIIALFIIFLACMNYTNLATALAIKRAKEVGVKKTFGANKIKLVSQFTVEAFLLTLIAFFISLIIVESTIPYFNQIIGKEIDLDYRNTKTILSFIIIPLITGITAGVFPAFYLATFKPAAVLKRDSIIQNKKFKIRYILVVLQFVITISFIVSTIVIFKQMHFLQNKSLGLDKNNILFFDQTAQIKKQQNSFKEELLKQPGVISVTYTSANPLSVYSISPDFRWKGKKKGDEYSFPFIQVDRDFINTFDINMIGGRDFLYPSDTNSILINEKALEIMGFRNPTGEVVEYWDRKATIVGVVKDFNLGDLHMPVLQLMIICKPSETSMVMVKFQGLNRIKAIRNIEKVYKAYEKNFPFDFKFVDEEYAKNYDSEKYLSRLSVLFAVLAIIVSCLGLFGLALFTAEQKTKEIGIRKSMGASTNNIMMILAKDFIWLIIISFTASCILTYYILNAWLQNYAYRTNMSWWIFGLTGIAITIIVILTVFWQSWRAANRNPVESLRYE